MPAGPSRRTVSDRRGTSLGSPAQPHPLTSPLSAHRSACIVRRTPYAAILFATCVLPFGLSRPGGHRVTLALSQTSASVMPLHFALALWALWFAARFVEAGL